MTIQYVQGRNEKVAVFVRTVDGLPQRLRKEQLDIL